MSQRIDVVGIRSCGIDYFAIVSHLLGRMKESTLTAWIFIPASVTGSNLTKVARLGATTGRLGRIGDDESGG
jgi:hypothetical protein